MHVYVRKSSFLLLFSVLFCSFFREIEVEVEIEIEILQGRVAGSWSLLLSRDRDPAGSSCRLVKASSLNPPFC
jgi:hypothetical protein